MVVNTATLVDKGDLPGGKAFDAGVDANNGRTRIVVETDGPKGVPTVTLDAQDASVVDTHPGRVAD